MPQVLFYRSFFIAIYITMVFSGGLILWGIANGVGVHGTCYDLPFGLEQFFPAPITVGGCFYIWYAGDLGIILILLGTLASFVTVRRSGDIAVG